MDAVERVRELVRPLVEREGVELYDIEYESGILRIMVDRPSDGIDVDTIGTLSQDISMALDADDPIPESRYLLEVTSPGIERRLRLPNHFAAQLGEEISVKVRRGVEGDRRFECRLTAADDNGIEVSMSTKEGEVIRRLGYDDIEMARLIFRWENEKGQKVSSTKAGHSQLNNDKKKASAR